MIIISIAFFPAVCLSFFGTFSFSFAIAPVFFMAGSSSGMVVNSNNRLIYSNNQYAFTVVLWLEVRYNDSNKFTIELEVTL